MIAAGMHADNDDERKASLWDAHQSDPTPETRAALFDAYLAFGRGIARRHHIDWSAGDLEFDDLFQLACTGLLEAIDRFDPGRGAPFESFAVKRVSGSIVDGLAHFSEWREQQTFKRRIRQERLRSLGTTDEVQGLTTAGAMAALADLAIGAALGFMLEGTGLISDKTTADPRPNAYESIAWKDMVNRLATEVNSLEPRERGIIRYHYGEGLTFEAIAALLHLSRPRISQIHRAALTRLRKRLLSGRQFSLRG